MHNTRTIIIHIITMTQTKSLDSEYAAEWKAADFKVYWSPDVYLILKRKGIDSAGDVVG